MAEQIGSGAAADLWRYACELYGREGSEQLLLGLQNDQGADVLLLIAACWVANLGLELEAGDWREVVAWQTPFRERVIEPLRQVRRNLLAQTGRSALYEQVKAAELAAEKAQLCGWRSIWRNGGRSVRSKACRQCSLPVVPGKVFRQTRRLKGASIHWRSWPESRRSALASGCGGHRVLIIRTRAVAPLPGAGFARRRRLGVVALFQCLGYLAVYALKALGQA